MKSRRRNGLTLTELLVVGTIILAVTALSIPVVKPMMESQLTKNGANMLATALNRARSRAQVNGRPCGICFEYWSGTYVNPSEIDLAGVEDVNVNFYPVNYDSLYGEDYVCYQPPGASLILHQVEVPPVYTGLLGTERVKINGGKCEFMNDPYLENKARETSNGKIQFGGSGPFYAFVPTDDGVLLKDGKTYALPPSRDTQYTFKVLLDSRRTMAMPVCMPRGTAVDLQFSGEGDKIFIDTVPDPTLPQKNSITIMFSPDGSVESVNGEIPTEPVHFLVGRWEQISDVRQDDVETLPNYADGRNFWVSVFPQTGAVTVSQVNPVNPPDVPDDLDVPNPDYRPDYRENQVNDRVYYVPDVRLPDGVIAISRELTR